MKVLVTGATGFIGRYVVRELKASGHSIVVVTRNSTKAKRQFGEVETLEADLSRETPKGEVLNSVEGVIHLMGESVAQFWTSSVKLKIIESRVNSTKNLLQGLKGAHLKAFVSASALGVYGDAEDRVLDESAPQGTGFLAGVCRDWEAALFNSEGSFRQVAVRVGIVLGKEGGALKTMLPAFKFGLGGPLGDGQQWMSWTHVEDLARLFVFCLDQQVAGPVNSTTPHPVTNEEFTKTLGGVLKRPTLFRVPKLALKALGEFSSVLLASQRLSPAKIQSLGFEFQYPRLDGALRNLLTEV